MNVSTILNALPFMDLGAPQVQLLLAEIKLDLMGYEMAMVTEAAISQGATRAQAGQALPPEETPDPVALPAASEDGAVQEVPDLAKDKTVEPNPDNPADIPVKGSDADPQEEKSKK